MCFWRVWPQLPLLIAANRDEFYARPASWPEAATVGEHGVRALAGRDARFGGSWMGANDAGLFVGLTNRRGGEARTGSRGEVVMGALAQRSAAAASDDLEARCEVGDFRFFNLLFGTIHDMRAARLDDGGLSVSALSPGLHILPSGYADLDDDRWPKVARARAALSPLLDAPPELEVLWPTLTATLADADTPPVADIPGSPDKARDRLFEAALQGIFVKTPVYGTRSSTVAAFDADGRLLRYAFTDANPAAAGWHNLEGLLRSEPAASPPTAAPAPPASGTRPLASAARHQAAP